MTTTTATTLIDWCALNGDVLFVQKGRPKIGRHLRTLLTVALSLSFISHSFSSFLSPSPSCPCLFTFLIQLLSFSFCQLLGNVVYRSRPARGPLFWVRSRYVLLVLLLPLPFFLSLSHFLSLCSSVLLFISGHLAGALWFFHFPFIFVCRFLLMFCAAALLAAFSCCYCCCFGFSTFYFCVCESLSLLPPPPRSVYLADKERAARHVDCLHFPLLLLLRSECECVCKYNYWKRMWEKPLTEWILKLNYSASQKKRQQQENKREKNIFGSFSLNW